MVTVGFQVSTIEIAEGGINLVCIDASGDFQRDVIVDVTSVAISAQGKIFFPP